MSLTSLDVYQEMLNRDPDEFFDDVEKVVEVLALGERHPQVRIVLQDDHAAVQPLVLVGDLPRNVTFAASFHLDHVPSSESSYGVLTKQP
jgi:hypothetical protein